MPFKWLRIGQPYYRSDHELRSQAHAKSGSIDKLKIGHVHGGATWLNIVTIVKPGATLWYTCRADTLLSTPEYSNLSMM